MTKPALIASQRAEARRNKNMTKPEQSLLEEIGDALSATYSMYDWDKHEAAAAVLEVMKKRFSTLGERAAGKEILRLLFTLPEPQQTGDSK
jgi:hypothetical protein